MREKVWMRIEKKEGKGLGGSVGGVRDEKKEFQRVLLYLKGKMSH